MSTPFTLVHNGQSITPTEVTSQYDEQPYAGHEPPVKTVTRLSFQKCPHTQLRLISSTEVRCACGAGWTGPAAARLYQAVVQTTE